MDDARRRLDPYLLPGEELVWTGRPDPAKHLTAADAYLVPFTLLWTGLSVSLLGTALARGAPLSTALFGLPFVVVGVYIVVGRFMYKASRKRRTVYGLTEGRALVSVADGSLAEAPLQRTPVDQRRSRDGRHVSVTFGRSTGGWNAGPSHANTGMELFSRSTGPLAFHDVSDVSGLETALRAVRR